MSDIEEPQMDHLSYTEGEQKMTEVVLEDDLDSSYHNEPGNRDSVNGESDREQHKPAEVEPYAPHAYVAEEEGHDESDPEYKFEHQPLAEPEPITHGEENEQGLKQSLDDEAVEEIRLSEQYMKEPDAEALPPSAMDGMLLPPSETINKVMETLPEANGNEENIRYAKLPKEQNGNIESISRLSDDPWPKQQRVGVISSKVDKFSRTVESTNTSTPRTKIEDNEMPTKGKVSSLKSLFESNAVHNSDTNKHSSYKHEYGVGKSSGVVNKGVFH